jgi:hypothetical protein
LIGTTEVPTPSPGTACADETGQRDRVVVELLSHPDLTNTEFICASRLRDDVVDHVGGIRAWSEHDSGRHTATNPRPREAYSSRGHLLR